MIKEIVICDRCGKEVKQPAKIYMRKTKYAIMGWSISEDRIELCEECGCELKRWLKEGGIYHD